MGFFTKIQQINTLEYTPVRQLFLDEINRLSESCKKRNQIDTNKQDLIEKRHRLVKLGFKNTNEIKEADLEIKRIKELEIENKLNSEIFDAIIYLNNKYPSYRFITMDSVNKLCKKLDYSCLRINKYVGDISESDIQKMEKIQINPEDTCYEVEEKRYNGEIKIDFYTKEKYEWKDKKGLLNDVYIFSGPSTFDIVDIKENFTENTKKSTPIILKPIIYREHKYYLVVSFDEISVENQQQYIEYLEKEIHKIK